MTWPQRFPDRPSGSQFGWRTFQGKQTFHYGRDQPAGVGAIHRAHADGKVLVHGHDRVYGFYLVVEYTGAPGVRHHIHQLQDRGRALGAGNFKKGDQLGLVGDPLLNIPVSERFNHATYCGSTFSTGPHSHEEVRTATQIDAAIDPAGEQATNIWAVVETHQATPAGSSGTNLTPLYDTLLGDDDMAQLRINKDTGVIYFIGALTWLKTTTDNQVNALGRMSGQFSPSVFRQPDETLDAAVRRVLTARGDVMTNAELSIVRNVVNANLGHRGLGSIPSDHY